MYKDNIFSTKQVEVTDVCGCGDTFLSALTYQYLIDKNINQSIIFANKAASITVQHIGVYAPTLKEIQ
jgi:sugar/nucleoside kinase (ribokinase family)